MSSKPANAYADSEYLRAAVIQKEHTENEHSVVVTTTVSLRRSPFVLVVRLEGYEARKGREGALLARYEVSWPNAYTMGFTAQLLQAYGKLDSLIGETRELDKWVESLASQ